MYAIFIKKSRILMSKQKVINFRIDADIKQKAKKLAEADGRSLSNWITRLIEREIRRSKK